MSADVIRTSPDLGAGLDAIALEAGLKRLAARADVQALEVFGSRASGRARPHSDLDLLVYGQWEAAKLGGSRWHVLGHGARSGRVLYVAE
jgi:hypothetical protein